MYEEDVFFHRPVPGPEFGGPPFPGRVWLRGGPGRGPFTKPLPPGLGFRRRFHTRQERIAELEGYLRELDAEAQGVREALEELRKHS